MTDSDSLFMFMGEQAMMWLLTKPLVTIPILMALGAAVSGWLVAHFMEKTDE